MRQLGCEAFLSSEGKTQPLPCSCGCLPGRFEMCGSPVPDPPDFQSTKHTEVSVPASECCLLCHALLPAAARSINSSVPSPFPGPRILAGRDRLLEPADACPSLPPQGSVDLDGAVDLLAEHEAREEANGAGQAEEAVADNEHVAKVHCHGHHLHTDTHTHQACSSTTEDAMQCHCPGHMAPQVYLENAPGIKYADKTVQRRVAYMRQ